MIDFALKKEKSCHRLINWPALLSPLKLWNIVHSFEEINQHHN